MPDPVDTYRHRSQDKLEQTSENNPNNAPTDPLSPGTRPVVKRVPTGCPPSQRLKKSALSRNDWQSEELIEPNETPSTAPDQQPMEQLLARELAETLSGSVDADDGHAGKDPDQQFEKACRDLVNKARQEIREDERFQQSPADPVRFPENVDEEFAKIAAANRTMMDWSSTRDFETASPPNERPEMVNALPEHPPSPERYSRAPSLAAGMTAVVIAIATTGVMLDVHKHPVFSGGVEWVKGPAVDAGSPNPPQKTDAVATTEPEEKVPATAKAKKADRVVVEVASAASEPSQYVAEGVTARMVSLPESKDEPSDPAEALDVLTVNLKLTEAYYARLKQAIEAGKPGQTTELEAEADKVQQEIDSLRSNLLAVHNGTPGADRSIAAATTGFQNALLPELAGGSGTSTALAAIEQQTNPEPRPVSKQPRNAVRVAQAMEGTPGLQLLDQLQRETLRQKLVSGECLVPALSSVFPQVPVLVMRDMVRQLDEGC